MPTPSYPELPPKCCMTPRDAIISATPCAEPVCPPEPVYIGIELDV
jgi:hypothetical protein